MDLVRVQIRGHDFQPQSLLDILLSSPIVGRSAESLRRF